MFRALIVRGAAGSLLLGGCSTAAELGPWTITKRPAKDVAAAGGGPWALQARVTRVDPFLVRRAAGLAFTAPRVAGFWWWPVRTLELGADRRSVRAVLEAPEQ
jgi:hypothetical protein